MNRSIPYIFVYTAKGGFVREIRVGFESALDFWRAARIAAPGRIVEVPEGKIYGARELSLSEQVTLACNLCNTEPPLDVVVPRADARINSERVNSHVWSGPLSEKHLVPLGDGVLVCRPVPMFLQLATIMDEIDLARVGYELCGTYALDADSERGFVDGIPPLVDIAELSAYARSAMALGIRGATRAMRALGIMAGGADSPRETDAAVFLASTRLRGGVGVPGFRMNVSIYLPEELAEALGQRTVRPDFSWPDGTVGEYDSDEYHRDPDTRARDERKRRAYQAVGLDCVTMTRGTFRSNAELDLFVADLETSLGLHRNPPNERMLAARRRLRERLFGPEEVSSAIRALRD